MAKDIKIPLRPRNKRYFMEASKMDCLAWYCISGCRREDAFRIFVRPDLAKNPKMLREYASQFFASTDAMNFIHDYRLTLEGEEGQEKKEQNEEGREKRIGNAIQKFTDKVIEKMSGDLESVDEMDAVAKLADRVGVLDDKKDIIESPRRYLPEGCRTCQYRLCIEKGIENGEIENECMYCKALKFAQNHGFVYDPKNVLEIPKKD